ncbi:MAG: DUF4399 domain-containing protein [Mariprofundus sp.]
MTLKYTAMMLLVGAGLLSACSSGAPEQSVRFVQPADGAVVGQDVNIVMAVDGMKVHKAGELIEGTGHHHLIIDGSFIVKGEGVPKDATHKHFGKGQTETTIRLAPGEHTLTLQFADGHHQSYGKPISTTITVHVK